MSVVEAAMAAARAGDLAALDALVDWPLSGVGALADALARVDPADRAALAQQGFAELSSPDPATRAGPLRRLQAALAGASVVRPVHQEMSGDLQVYDADGFIFAVTPDGVRLVVRT